MCAFRVPIQGELNPLKRRQPKVRQCDQACTRKPCSAMRKGVYVRVRIGYVYIIGRRQCVHVCVCSVFICVSVCVQCSIVYVCMCSLCAFMCVYVRESAVHLSPPSFLVPFEDNCYITYMYGCTYRRCWYI
jgi:hypothetical protein